LRDPIVGEHLAQRHDARRVLNPVHFMKGDAMKIYRPDGPIAEPAHALSPGRRVIAGARIGVLDNLKPNAGLLMGRVANQLADRAGTGSPVVLTKNAAQPAPEEVLDRLQREADLVLTGSAD
jgi:hypothetical protein